MNKPLKLVDNCLKIGSGATPRGGKDAYLASGPYSLIRSQNVHNDAFYREGLAFISDEQAHDLRNVEVREGDVLLNITGDSVARACQVDAGVLPARVNQHVAIIRPDPEKIDPRFLRYFLVAPQTQEFMLGLASAGATRNALTKSMIEGFELPPVDIKSQRSIGATLGVLDDKIELNRRMKETLEATAQAIFHDWFVAFGPVRRKMEGTTDPAAIMGGLVSDPVRAAELAELFPNGFGENELPVGWQTTRLESLIDLAYGKSMPKTERREGSVPVYGSGGIGGYHDAALNAGPGIIVGRKGTVGSLFWAPGPFFAIDTVFYVVPKAGVPLNFAWQLLQTLGLPSMNTDAAVPGLNRSNVYRLEVPQVPARILGAFDEAAGALRAMLDAKDTENRTLAETRDYLLPRLMSGEVRVGDVQSEAAA